MRIAICDDEERYRLELKTILNKLLINIDCDIDTFSDGNMLSADFRANPYDLVFLDIEMPEVDGITLAKKLRSLSDKVYIVFLTSHIEYALEGYEVNALRYLTKPVNIDKLKEVIRYVQDREKASKQIIIKEDGSGTTSVILKNSLKTTAFTGSTAVILSHWLKSKSFPRVMSSWSSAKKRHLFP